MHTHTHTHIHAHTHPPPHPHTPTAFLKKNCEEFAGIGWSWISVGCPEAAADDTQQKKQKKEKKRKKAFQTNSTSHRHFLHHFSSLFFLIFHLFSLLSLYYLNLFPSLFDFTAARGHGGFRYLRFMLRAWMPVNHNLPLIGRSSKSLTAEAWSLILKDACSEHLWKKLERDTYKWSILIM